MTVPDNIQDILANDPGNEYFIEYANHLKAEGRLGDAMQVCLAGLSARPAAHSGRFILAKMYYEQGHLPFAVRELRELSRALPAVESLQQLIRRFEPDAKPAVEASVAVTSETVAESEFDIDEIELIDDE